jgi:hypothetical protein
MFALANEGWPSNAQKVAKKEKKAEKKAEAFMGPSIHPPIGVTEALPPSGHVVGTQSTHRTEL